MEGVWSLSKHQVGSGPCVISLQCQHLLLCDCGRLHRSQFSYVAQIRPFGQWKWQMLVRDQTFNFTLVVGSCVSLLTNNRVENYSSLRAMTCYCEDQKSAQKNAVSLQGLNCDWLFTWRPYIVQHQARKEFSFLIPESIYLESKATYNNLKFIIITT